MRLAQSQQLLVVRDSLGARPRRSHGFTGGYTVTGAESVRLSFASGESGAEVGLRRGCGRKRFVLQ